MDAYKNIREYLSGKELIDKNEIELFQLHELVEQGLESYDKQTGKLIKTLSADEGRLWIYTQTLALLKGKFKSSIGSRLEESFFVHKIYPSISPSPHIRLQDGLPSSAELSDPTFPAKQTIKNFRASGKELSELEKDNLDKFSRTQHKEHIKQIKNVIKDLEVKKIEVPQITIIEWQRSIVLNRSKETLARLEEAKYKTSQFLELRGGLPDSCPNNTVCRDAFSQTEKTIPDPEGSNSPFNEKHPFEKAKYKTSQFLELRGGLPDSCPNNTVCRDAFSQTEKTIPDPDGSNSPFNEKHPFYSTELAVAIKCWNHFFANRKQEEDRLIKENINKWLKKNYPKKVTNEALNRMSTLVNPDWAKEGGAPKTPGND
ncbi:hypothetical protein DSUL_190001 [Desulfovibrionales bacterium]